MTSEAVDVNRAMPGREVLRPIFFLLVLLFGTGSSTGLAGIQIQETEGFVPVEGGRLFYKEAGTGEAVILIHGGFLDHRMWDGQVQALARGHRVVRYDVRSHGRSHAEPVPFSDMTDLAVLMDSLDITRATIVGLSMGGQIAVDFALLNPERIRSLVLVGPGMSGYPFDSPELARFAEELGEVRENNDFQGIIEVFTRYWCDGPRRSPEDVDPAVRSKVLEMLSGSRERWAQVRLGEVLVPPAMGRLSSIQVPTLAVLGLIDMPDIHGIVDLLASQIPGAERVDIPGVAHMVNLEAPERFNQALLEFLGG